MEPWKTNMKTSHTNISGILHTYKNGWVVHYSDIVWIHDINVRLDSMANNLQKQKGQQNYKVNMFHVIEAVKQEGLVDYHS